MRILIDECLNWRLSRALTGHYAVSTQKMGWGGIKNGALLAKAAQEFDVFVTSTQLHHTLPLMSKILALLKDIKPGQVLNVYP